MAAIRNKDTKPEIKIRKALFAKGFRYRLHNKKLPGKPDLVLPKYNAVIMINGCFWHGHDCPLFKWPETRKEFWYGKITYNQENDKKVLTALQEQGWRILTVWECALKGKQKKPFDNLIDEIVTWVKSDSAESEIRGQNGN